jgi:alkanesulfonate monooxygenase SsuD/methylene tetrahydromethanopterin reductase-like flavin-dependent oxidoreductase (luciferase family)
MRFGLHTGQHQVEFEELRDLWRDASAWGFDACYLFDHIVPLYSDVEAFLPEEAMSPDGPCLEGVTALAALARAVPGIGVGLMVAGVGYRSAGYLAHAVATLAQAAPGRLEIGIGAGWYEPDYRIMSLPFPPGCERLDELEGALEVLTPSLRAMDPAPRLWVAGTGERRTIPIAARYANSWNAMYLTPDEYARKVAVLDDACRRAAREPSSVERSIALRAFCAEKRADAVAALEAWARARGREPGRLEERSLVGTPGECAEQLARYAEAGATHCAVMAHPPYDREGLRLLARECLPLLGGNSRERASGLD